MDLSHWGRVTYIFVGNLTIIGSDNGLSPGRHQGIIWTNAEILLIEQLRNKFQWNFDQNSYIFSLKNAFENVARKMVAILSRRQCVKSLWLSEAIWHDRTWSTWVLAWQHQAITRPNVGQSSVGFFCILFMAIDLFHDDFFPLAVSSPNTVNYLVSYNNQLQVV